MLWSYLRDLFFVFLKSKMVDSDANAIVLKKKIIVLSLLRRRRNLEQLKQKHRKKNKSISLSSASDVVSVKNRLNVNQSKDEKVFKNKYSAITCWMICFRYAWKITWWLWSSGLGRVSCKWNWWRWNKGIFEHWKFSDLLNHRRYFILYSSHSG